MNLSTRFLHIFDSYGFCFSFLALVEQIPLTKACGSQCNRETLYSPFVPLQYHNIQIWQERLLLSLLVHQTSTPWAVTLLIAQHTSTVSTCLLTFSKTSKIKIFQIV